MKYLRNSNIIYQPKFEKVTYGKNTFKYYVFIQKEVTYGLRDVNLLVQPKFKTLTYGHNTIKYQGSKWWNNLPNDLKKKKLFVIF